MVRVVRSWLLLSFIHVASTRCSSVHCLARQTSHQTKRYGEYYLVQSALHIDIILLSTCVIELICGDVNYYCPRGTSFPIRVTGGYYSTGGNYDNQTRSGQEICPPGSYCINAIPYLCAKGRYGSVAGLAVIECEADCPAGYFCPPGTVNPFPCPEGSYSTGKVAQCTQCPGTRTTPMKCKTDNTCCLRD